MKISINTIWQRSRDYSYTLGLIKRQINIFWKEVLASWLQIDEKKNSIKKSTIVWHNPQITIDNKSFC